MKFGKGGILALFLFALGLLFVTFILFSTILLFYDKVENISENNEVYMSSDIGRNGTSYGFVRIKKDLVDEEYLSYYNPDFHWTTVISNFADEEYECTGSCYCLEEKFRRNTATTLSQGMFIILTALTAGMAISIAKETMKNDCVESLTGICAIRNIQAEVDNCEIVKHIEDPFDEYEDKTQQREYYCHGHCVESKQHAFHDTTEVDKDRGGPNINEARKAFGDCSRLKVEGTVEIMIYTYQEIRHSNQYARHEFQSKILTPFCRDQSLVKVNVRIGEVFSFGIRKYIYDAATKKQKYFRERKINACGSGLNRMKNIKCKLIKKEYL